MLAESVTDEQTMSRSTRTLEPPQAIKDGFTDLPVIAAGGNEQKALVAWRDARWRDD
jgi:hypothetical protein